MSSPSAPLATIDSGRIYWLHELAELVTVREAAGVLRCGDTTVRGMLAAGQLTRVDVGRLVRIRRAELERIVRGKPA